MYADFGALHMRQAEQLSPFKFYHGEPEKSQQGEHHKNQIKCMDLPSIKYHRERGDMTETMQAYTWPVQCQQQSVGNGC